MPKIYLSLSILSLILISGLYLLMRLISDEIKKTHFRLIISLNLVAVMVTHFLIAFFFGSGYSISVVIAIIAFISSFSIGLSLIIDMYSTSMMFTMSIKEIRAVVIQALGRPGILTVAQLICAILKI